MSDLDQNSAGSRSLEELAESELRRRLEDPEEARKLAGTGLLNLVLSFEKQKALVKLEDLDEDIDPLEVINSVDLPDDRKRELILQELDRLDTLRVGLTNALEVEDDTPTDGA
jgi:hypothetical protein